tara:strand:+ start:1522 stop:1755 length:234 start_codon:yes stop_codon:yes gene_type:complete
MKMHKEKYEKLLRRFSQELHEVGVSENLNGLVQDQIDRAPNVIVASAEETTERFTYRHEGYMIEAVRTVKLVVKTTK